MVQELNRRTVQKKVFGVTGVFGSGKSTVAALFRKKGGIVLDADAIAKSAFDPKSGLYTDLKMLLGSECFDSESGEVNRKKVAEMIFRDARKRQDLEGLVHPFVREKIEREIEQAESEFIFLDIPLLYEVGWDPICDAVIVVGADEKKIQERLLEKGFSLEDILQRTAAQWPLVEKEARADFVIKNNEELLNLEKQVDQVWEKLTGSMKGDQ